MSKSKAGRTNIKEEISTLLAADMVDNAITVENFPKNAPHKREIVLNGKHTVAIALLGK